MFLFIEQNNKHARKILSEEGWGIQIICFRQLLKKLRKLFMIKINYLIQLVESNYTGKLPHGEWIFYK
ncbi:hypothetical protein FD20_GL000043 [Liquorilactobacillus uvarum DSM 19971]|uniref:Uncharacterized protein n=1 Tax=Liquorilactobacillus uvarum DSM 19971 TaxID=1423812 RepID=A0A0R1Q2Z4_9LACO|nr:hypothetical protein FD20_GL000043 [Liquorilactobacillus uvarum DSM 19971]